LVVVGIVAAVLSSYPWFVLSVMGVLYLASVPFSYRSQQRFAAAQDSSAPQPGAEDEPENEGQDDAAGGKPSGDETSAS
jgi:CDP-diacylglycerol--serine O-phosphatidyltransferase